MKARLPQGYGSGPSNPQAMMRQIQKMQEQMAQKQAELEATEYTATAGGGAVEVTMNGKRELTALVLKPEVVDPEDVEMLQDLVIAAVNEVIRKVDSTSEAEMGKITGNLNVPGMPGLF